MTACPKNHLLYSLPILDCVLMINEENQGFKLVGKFIWGTSYRYEYQRMCQKELDHSMDIA